MLTNNIAFSKKKNAVLSAQVCIAFPILLNFGVSP